MPSQATSIPRRPSVARSAESSSRIGLVLLTWIRILRVSSGSRQPLQHAAGAALRQMADLARALARDAQPDHLLVAPEGAIDQHACGRRIACHTVSSMSPKPGRIDERLPARSSRAPAPRCRRAAAARDSGSKGRVCRRRAARATDTRDSPTAKSLPSAAIAGARCRSSGPAPRRSGCRESDPRRRVGAPDLPGGASTRAACKDRWCDRPGHPPARWRRSPCRAAHGPAEDRDSPASG